MKIIFLFILLQAAELSAAGFNYFTGSETGGSPLEYLSLFGVNAAAAGIGNAFTAKTGSVSSPYWNPAGLSGLYFTEISVMNAMLFADTQFTYVGMGYPTGHANGGVFGLGINRLSSGYAVKTDSLGREFGNFSEIQTCILLTYSRKFGERYGAGINFKILDQTMEALAARGYGLDAGMVIYDGDSGSLGVSLQNIPYVQMGGDTAGMNLKTGIYRNIIRSKLNIAADISVMQLNNMPFLKWAAGAEYVILDLFILRAGLNTREITAGFGFKTESISFDYAVGAHPVDFTHKLSVSVRYGHDEDESGKRLSKEREQLKQDKENAVNEIRVKKEDLEKQKAELKMSEWTSSKMTLARGFFEKGNYENAEKILLEVKLRDPQDQNAGELLNEINKRLSNKYAREHYAKALELYKSKDFAGALAEARKAVSSDPENKAAAEMSFICQARLFANDGKYNEAKGELFELFKINPDNKEAMDLMKKVQTLIEISPEGK